MIIGNYKNCNVFIKDQLGNVITESVVLEQDRERMTLTVEGSVELSKSNEVVTLLILQPDGVHSFLGHTRRSLGNLAATDIDIYRGTIKEARKAKRFKVNTKAVVPNLMINRNPVPLLHPLSVKVINLSASGALIQSRLNSFAEHSNIEMSLNIGGRDTNIYGEIVHIKEVDNENAEYGCKFYEIK